MHCCKNWSRVVYHLLLVVCFACFSGGVWAAGVEVKNPRLFPVEEGYALSADFAIEFNPRLEEAIAKGLVLYFVLEFELERPRWYWMDEKLSSRSQVWRLSYHALTRQYRLSTGGAFHQSFDTLESALQIISRVRRWQVVEGTLKPGEYQAALRFRLDISQLPKPFQVSALTNRDWNLNSDWFFWKLSFPLPSSEQEGKPDPEPGKVSTNVVPEQK